MRLETLTIRGLLAFSAPMTLDLRELPPGLVAIVGPIGQGKTTILESCPAGLFREYPTRKKPIFDYALGGDACIEQTFALDGDGVYRARLNLDGPRRRADAVLLRIDPDGTTRALSDGKLPSFDAAVAALLPPLPAWLASVFSSQNRAGSFVNLAKADRKALFASFLGLDQLEAWAEKAKLAGSQVQIVIDRLRAKRELLVVDVSDAIEARLQADADQLQVEGGAAEARQVELDRDIRALEAELAGLQSAAAAHASAQATFDHCSFTIRTTASERETARAALERVDHDAAGERQQLVRAHTIAIEALDRKAADTRARDAERERIGSELAKHLAELDERIANNRTILAEATEIRAAARDFDRYEAEATEARTAERAAIADVQHAQARAQAVRARLTDLATNEAALTRATQAAGLLTTVPFGDDCAPCKFMTTAAAAKAEIPALEERCAERGAIERDQADATAAVETAERAVTELHERIVSIERLREGLRKKAARLPNLEQAEQRIADLERQKQDAQAAAASQGEHADAREAARQTELVEAKALREREHVEQRAALDRRTADRRTELKARIETLADRETALTFERDALADELAATKDASERAAAQTALQTLRRNEWTDVVTTVARVEMARAELERRRDALRAKRRELAGVDAEVARLTEDLIEWQLLGQALGRDGLQTLEIDAAGPVVSAFCNDLLRACGLPFTVDLVTQQAKVSKGKDGSTQKEVFELKVYDSERGGVARDLADLSGGQQVLVDEALKSAIALLVNQRNVQPIRTCWRDETTGSLDPDTAQRYVEMLRRVHQLGGFHHVLFITHNPEAALQAAAQVVVNDGRAEVRLPPFTAEAA